jgi:twinkle protein
MNPVVFNDDEIDFAQYMDETEAEHRVRSPQAWRDDLIEEFSGGDQSPGARLPWTQTHGKIGLRTGEVSLWFGFNGHGKSLGLGQAVLGLAAQGERTCVASFEMRPRKTLARMCRQHADAFAPGEPQIDRFLAFCDRRIWVYDQINSVEAAKVYAVIRYAAAEREVTHFVVDNLTKCVAADDDYKGQKAVVDQLCTLAQALNIHIHLVHHARKGVDETRPPRKMDALGASAITNLVDNVFVLWRNKAKSEEPAQHEHEPDAMLICDKQRHGSGWEGVINLNYHQRSQQYTDHGYEAMHFERSES